MADNETTEQKAARLQAEKDAAAAAEAKKPVKRKRHQFHSTFYDAGVPKYVKGQHYPITDETASQVIAGNAVEVEVEVDADEHAEQATAAKAALRSVRARTIEAEADARRRGELKDKA